MNINFYGQGNNSFCRKINSFQKQRHVLQLLLHFTTHHYQFYGTHIKLTLLILRLVCSKGDIYYVQISNLTLITFWNMGLIELMV